MNPLSAEEEKKLQDFQKRTKKLATMPASSPDYRNARHEYRTMLYVSDQIANYNKQINELTSKPDLTEEEQRKLKVLENKREYYREREQAFDPERRKRLMHLSNKMTLEEYREEGELNARKNFFSNFTPEEVAELDRLKGKRKLTAEESSRIQELKQRSGLTPEQRQRKAQLEEKMKANKARTRHMGTLSPTLQRLMSLGDPTQDPQSAKEMAAAFAYINPLQQMLDFTNRVDEAAVTGESLDTGEFNQRLIGRINKMFAPQLQSQYGVSDVMNLDSAQLAEFRNAMQAQYIDPNSDLLVDVKDEKTNQIKKSFYPIKAFLQQMMGGTHPIKGPGSSYAQSLPLLERFGSMDEIMDAAGTLGIQPELNKGGVFANLGNLVTQMLTGTDTTRQAGLAGTSRRRNPAVTNAVPTASVGDGSGGGMFGGGGGGGGGRPPSDDDYGGEGGYRSITISNATIQGMTANSVGITLQGGSLVLNGQNVELGQRGYSGFSSGSSQDPIVNAVVNRLALARTRASEQLAQISDPEERVKVQKETMTSFGKVAFDALNTSIGVAGRKLIGSKGFAKDKGAFMDDPLGSLEEYTVLSQKLYDSQAEEIAQLSEKEFLPDVDKARLAELTQSNESLSRFINLIRELRTQLEFTSKSTSQQTRNYQTKPSSGQYPSSSPEVQTLEGTVNLLNSSRNSAIEELSKQTNADQRNRLRAEAIGSFGNVVSSMFTDSPVFKNLLGRLGISKSYGIDLPNLSNMRDNPVDTLDELSLFNANLSSTLAERKLALEGTVDRTPAEQAELESITAAENDLKIFSDVIKRLNVELNKTQGILSSRPAEDRTIKPKEAGSERSRTTYTGSMPLGQRTRYDAIGLQAFRSQYEQSLGFLGTASAVSNRKELMDLTSGYINNTVEAVGLPTIAQANIPELDAEISSLADALATLALPTRSMDELAGKIRTVSMAMQAFLSSGEALYQTADEQTKEKLAPLMSTAREGFYALDVGMREARASEGVSTNTRRQQLSSLREQMQSNASQNYLLGAFSPTRAIRERRALDQFFENNFTTRRGAQEIYQNGEVVVRRADGKGYVPIDLASQKDIQSTSAYLSSSAVPEGSDVSVETLQNLQRVVSETKQQKNQAPYARAFNDVMNTSRNIQTAFTYVQSAFNLPQTLVSTIKQFAEPQLNAVRTLTTARALSLGADRYNQVLGAASNLRERFGGTVTGQLGGITSFIPLTNAYGVDLDKTVTVARKLAAFDPAQGMEGASIAIKEFLSGNVASLSRRFEINRSSLSKINSGSPVEMLESLNELLNSMGVTDRLIDEQANSMATRYDKMIGSLDQVFINLSSVAVSSMTPVLESFLLENQAGLDIPGIGPVNIAKFARDRSFEVMLNESAMGEADAVFSGEGGLDSVDIYGKSTDFMQNVDKVLNEANLAMGKASERYASTVGVTAQFDAYRVLGNMSNADRTRVQALSQRNVGAGMTTSQAILQALRDVGGDYLSSQVDLGYRRQLGYYDDIALSDKAQTELVRSMAAGNEDGWNKLGRNVRVIEVFDADTVRVEDVKTGATRVVRLAGIDAPEKDTEEGKAATEFARREYLNKEMVLQGDALDDYGRLVGMLSMGGVNINADLLRRGYASKGFLDRVEMSDSMRQQFEMLDLSAANSGVGPVNSLAARAGLGAAPIISKEAIEAVYQDQYGWMNDSAGVGGGILGAIGGGAIAKSSFGRLQLNNLSKLVRGANPSNLRMAAGSFSSFGASNAASMAASLAIGYGVGKIAEIITRKTFEEDKSYEKRKAQMEKQAEIDTDKQAVKRSETVADSLAQYAPLSQDSEILAKDNQYLRNQINLLEKAEREGVFNDAAELERRGVNADFINMQPERRVTFIQGMIDDQQATIDAERIATAGNLITPVLDYSYEASRRYQVMFGQMDQYQKEVQGFKRVSPVGQERMSLANIRKYMDTVYMSGDLPGSKEALKSREALISEFETYYNTITENAELFANAVEDGATVVLNNIPEGVPYSSEIQPLNTKLTNEVLQNASASDLLSIKNQLTVARFTTYNQESKNYSDQLMERMMQLRQTRFNNMMDIGASIAFTPAGAAATRDALQTKGLEVLNESRMQQMFKITGIDDPGIVKGMYDSMRQAEEAYIATAEAFREQEDLTYMFNMSYGSTMRNLLATINDQADADGTNFKTVMANMGQGNPTFLFEFLDRMMGINPKQMLMQGYTPNMPLRTGPTGAVSFGYSQGPLGQIAQFTDILRSPFAIDSFNLGEYQTALDGLAQAQTQVTMRGIQFNNQMRDLTINHNRTLEDIARNNGRQLESIHRNFAREMKVSQQANEVNKRADSPNFYENLISKTATLSPEVIRSIDQQYVNDKNEANRLGVLNYEVIKKDFPEESPEFTALIDEYTSIDPSDYAAREEFFQTRLRPAGDALRAELQQKYDAAEGPEKERYGVMLNALTPDPQRADKFGAQAITKANETTRRESVKADNVLQLERLVYQEEGIKNQIADAEKNLREKRDTMTPEEYRDAEYALRGMRTNLEDNRRAQKSAQAQIDSVTATLPLYEDSVRETWNSILRDTTTALGQMRTNLNEFSITAKQQIEDAQINLDRSTADVIRQFNDAAVEVTKTVPKEFAKMLNAILAYNSTRTNAQLIYDSGQGVTGQEGINIRQNAQDEAVRGAGKAAEILGLNEKDTKRLQDAARASFPVNSPVLKSGESKENPDLAKALYKYSYKGSNAIQVVIVGDDRAELKVPDPVNQYDLEPNGGFLQLPGTES
jgi:hypothetical protein